MRINYGTAALPLSVFYTGTACLKKAPPVCPGDELIRVIILQTLWETKFKLRTMAKGIRRIFPTILHKTVARVFLSEGSQTYC